MWKAVQLPVLNIRNISAMLLYCYKREAPDGMIMKYHVIVYEDDLSILHVFRIIPMLVNTTQ